MKRGLLIVVEGIDGAGKTTHARRIVRWLRERGIKAHYTFEPTRGENSGGDGFEEEG